MELITQEEIDAMPVSKRRVQLGLFQSGLAGLDQRWMDKVNQERVESFKVAISMLKASLPEGFTWREFWLRCLTFIKHIPLMAVYSIAYIAGYWLVVGLFSILLLILKLTCV